MSTDIPPSSSEPDEGSNGHLSFPLVGIGASAGGLEAMTALLEHLPVTTGMAYVIVQHLAPTHQSILPSLLARVTSLPGHLEYLLDDAALRGEIRL